jgi:large subunit ribosomal protein L4
MSKVSLYNQKGEVVGETLLPKEIFDIKMSPDLVHQVVIAQMGNRRKIIADTKNRSEVSGGGKKPWRQKGTGRARHGSTRSPLWRHGGITFGPTTEVSFKKEIPNKMKRKALFMVISEKARKNLLIIVEDLKIEKVKTKLMTEILKKLPSKGKTALIALPGMDKDIIIASRNISGIETMQAKDLNCLDLLSWEYLILPKESVKKIKEVFGKSKVKE